MTIRNDHQRLMTIRKPSQRLMTIRNDHSGCQRGEFKP
jgi:hypothetical protein